MSKFKTSFPFDVEAIKRLLPPGAFFGGVEWDKEASELRVLWDFDTFRTPVDFAWEFPVENLQRKELPEGVVLEQGKRIPATIIRVQPVGETPEGCKRVAYTIGEPRIVKVDFQPEVKQQDVGVRDVPADLVLEGKLPVTEAQLDELLAEYDAAKAAKAKADAEAPTPISEVSEVPTAPTAETPAPEPASEASAPAPATEPAVMTPAVKPVAKKGKGK